MTATPIKEFVSVESNNVVDAFNAVIRDINKNGANTVTLDAFSVVLVTFFNNIPTIKPAQSGQIWNDGGVLCIS